jgi:hypothetical protein
MRIWIDADACPKVVKEIVFKASLRTNTPVVLVANKALAIPLHGLISIIQVPAGFDMADERIIQEIKKGDLVITADIPLADAVIEAGSIAINPRGERYTKDNIKEHLATRDLMAELRDSGFVTKGPKTFGPKEKQAFANALDALLRKSK